MKAEGIYKFTCPADLDSGPASIRAHIMTSSAPIEGDLTYEFDILEAGTHPHLLDLYYHPLNDLKNGVCFYIVSAGSDGKGSPYAIEAAK